MRLKSIAVIAIASLSACTFSKRGDKKPDDNRFTKVVLAQRIKEPMQFQIMKDGKVLYAERKGKLKLYDPATGKISVIAEFPVSTTYVSKTGEVSEAEDGLQGVILDPDFGSNHWIYVYYSPAGSDPKNSLVRYSWDGKGPIVAGSGKVLLNVVVQRFECCHVGGGMVFDKDRNLYLSTGDNTFSRASDGFSPLDQRSGMSTHDSQRSSSNTNDLRGKILRIHPEEDGTYTIPKGNLFPKGTAKARPEIYTMGNRNPWRLTIDSKTGWLYWGEVGPDGGRDDFAKRGPQSYDEFNMAKKPGNYGWPYFVADNKAYRKYDFATHVSGDFYNSAHPVNESPNNTGLVDLPPATPSLIWYGKDASKEFPLMGSGSNSAVGGPIYHRSDFANPKRPFPEYYEGKWFITDWVRGWINVVTLNRDGSYKSMERFLPNLRLKGPIDMKFGPEGDLYVLEYGNGYFKDNPGAELIKIKYNGGNRKPQVEASASKTAGAVPLKVNLSSTGTKDFDEGNVLTYQWKIMRNNLPYRTSKQPDTSVILTTPGVYKAVLTATDSKGASSSKSIEIEAGNEPPIVKLNITAGNRSFFFPGKRIDYAVTVSDKEDGSLENKRIMPARVSVSADYLSEGFDMAAMALTQNGNQLATKYTGAINLIGKNDCKSCHSVSKKVLGPAFVLVARKYKDDPGAPDHLYKKIISGGSGIWGNAMMPAHPTLAESDAKAIVRYILSLAYPPHHAKPLPVKGSYATIIPKGEGTGGSFILRASYTDNGTSTATAQTGESIVILSAPSLPASRAIESKDITFNIDSTRATVTNAGAWLKFGKVDLTDVKQLRIAAQPRSRMDTTASGTIEVHAGSLQGTLLGVFSGKYNRKSIIINLPGNTSIDDLYLVFSGSPLRITGITFNDDDR